MLMTKNAPRMKAPSKAWTRWFMLEGLKTIAQKSVMFAWLFVDVKPAGVCCQELATMIQTAEKIEPSATMNVAKKCIRGETRSQPKTSTARKPDSRKKAKMPSAASAEPKTSPT